MKITKILNIFGIEKGNELAFKPKYKISNDTLSIVYNDGYNNCIVLNYKILFKNLNKLKIISIDFKNNKKFASYILFKKKYILDESYKLDKLKFNHYYVCEVMGG